MAKNVRPLSAPPTENTDNRSRAVCNHVQPTAVTLNIPNAKEKKTTNKTVEFANLCCLDFTYMMTSF